MKTPVLLLSTLSLSALAAEPTTVNSQITDTATQSNQTAQLDTVNVTADFRQLDLMQIPSSITVVGEEDIQNRNADHLESVLSLAPNVNFASGASRARYFQIRGIGERSQFTDPTNPSVGLMMDGIDLTGLGAAATLFDIGQIEILRGPQGTAFGANALAGAINIVSNEQSTDNIGYIDFKAGNYNSKKVEGAFSTTISDNLTSRVAIQSNTSDGYIKNAYLNKENTNGFDEKALKANIKWTDDIQAYKLNILKVKTDNGYDAFTIDNTRTTQSDEPGKDTINLIGASLQSSHTSSPRFIIETNTEYTQSDSVYSYDYDWMHEGFRTHTGTDFESFNREIKNGSFDLRLLSTPLSNIFNTTTSWTTGIYTRAHKQDLIQTRIENSSLTNNYSSEFKTNSVAIYSELTSTLTNTTQITYGIRIEELGSDYTDSKSLNQEFTETLYGGSISLNTLVGNSLVYGNVSRGYKAGGFNSDASLSAEEIKFKTEYNISTELGLKSSLLNDTLKTNVAVFYISRENMQTNNSSTPDNGNTFIIAINNAASGKNYGIEAEGSYTINEDATLNLSLGLLETEINDYIQPYTNIDISGREQAHAPSYSFSTSLDLNLTQAIEANLEVVGKDKFYFSDSHDAKSTSYELLNASISYTKSNWKFSLIGKNLTDEKVETRGFSGWTQDPLGTIAPEKYVQFGEPRLISLSARYDF